MKVGQKVRVTKPQLLTTGREGEIVGFEGHLVAVKFDGLRRALNYNRASLQIVKEQLPEVKEDKFEIVEINVLKVAVEAFYWIVFTNAEGVLKCVKRRIRQRNLDHEEQQLVSMDIVDDTIPYDKIQYIFKSDEFHTFKQPEPNVFPFWVDKDKLSTVRCSSLKIVNGKTATIIRRDGIEFPIEWAADIEAFKPEFEKVEKRVLKEGAFDDGEVEEAILNLMQREAREAEGNGMSFGTVWQHKKTKEPKIHTEFGRPCHANMRSMDRNFNRKTDEILFAVQYLSRHYFKAGKGREELFKRYTEWVMNDSPWSQYIMTKTWDDAVKYGIRVRVDIPANAMMCTFYALRYPTEYPEKIVKWGEYVDGGMLGAAAFFVAETRCVRDDASGHHMLLDTHSMNIDDLKDFINHKKGKIVYGIYKDEFDYSRVSVHHGSKNGRYGMDSAVEQLKKMDIYTGKRIQAGFEQIKEVDLGKLTAILNAMKENENENGK